MRKVNLEELSVELRRRILSVLKDGEDVSSFEFAVDESGVTIVYKEVVGGGFVLLGCSECIGVEDPPSFPFSALTAEETNHTPFDGVFLCRSCSSRTK